MTGAAAIIVAGWAGTTKEVAEEATAVTGI